jgi:hypothetical protein
MLLVRACGNDIHSYVVPVGAYGWIQVGGKSGICYNRTVLVVDEIVAITRVIDRMSRKRETATKEED